MSLTPDDNRSWPSSVAVSNVHDLPPAVLVAHGSPDHRSRAVVHDIATAARATAAFLDFDAPHPVAVLKALADNGHRRVRLVPLLLTHAHHGSVDIPRVAAAAVAERPGLSVEVTGPVGGSWLLPALARTLPEAEAVVFASAGTRNVVALSGFDDLATELSGLLRMPAVTAFASTAAPSVPEAVARLRRDGARRIAVASYFIAPGVLHDRVKDAAAEVGAVGVTPPLGIAPELVAAIVRRYSSPTDRLEAGINSSTAVPIPSTHEGKANHHRPAFAR